MNNLYHKLKIVLVPIVELQEKKSYSYKITDKKYIYLLFESFYQ